MFHSRLIDTQIPMRAARYQSMKGPDVQPEVETELKHVNVTRFKLSHAALLCALLSHTARPPGSGLQGGEGGHRGGWRHSEERASSSSFSITKASSSHSGRTKAGISKGSGSSSATLELARCLLCSSKTSSSSHQS